MKRTTKRYLVDEDTYNGFNNEPKIHHPDVVSTLKTRQDMHDILKNPAMNDYDKVTHHATKLQRYLNNLQLALTRSKAAAVLGTPFGALEPHRDLAREMNAQDESDDEDMDAAVDQIQPTPSTSTFQTPMATTPSVGLQSLTPPDTPMTVSTFRPRRRVTKSPTATSTTEQLTSNTKKTSTVETLEKRTAGPRLNKQKFGRANLLKHFPKASHTQISNVIDQMQNAPKFRWDGNTGDAYLNDKQIKKTNIIGLLSDLTDPSGKLTYTSRAMYKKLTDELTSA